MNSAVIVFILIIGIVATVCELMARRKIIPVIYSRKILHITAITLCAVSPIYIADKMLLISIVAFFAGVLYFAIRYHWLYVNKGTTRSWGILYFAIAFLVLLILFYDNHKWLIIIPMLIMAWSDAAAGIAGQLFAKKKYKILADDKSLVGNIVFFVATMSIFIMIENFCQHKNILPAYWFQLTTIHHYFLFGIIAFLLTIIEAMSSRGSDNIFVPLCAALLLYFFLTGILQLSIQTLSAVLGVSILFSSVAYRKKSLSPDGAIAAFFMAFFIAGIGGFKWTLPILVFFICGTMFSRWNRNYKILSDEKSKKPRDFIQVFANGGVALLLILLYAIYKHEWIFVLYAASISASTADTFASEIGIRSQSQVYDILTLKPLAKGVSGGVTLLGFAATFLGAATICTTCFILDTSTATHYLWLVLVAGILGSIIDSILGSAFQAKYFDSATNELTDIANIKTNNKLAQGFSIVTNDVVNILSNMLATTIIYFLLKMI